MPFSILKSGPLPFALLARSLFFFSISRSFWELFYESRLQHREKHPFPEHHWRKSSRAPRNSKNFEECPPLGHSDDRIFFGSSCFRSNGESHPIAFVFIGSTRSITRSLEC